MAARAGVEPTTLRLKAIDSTKAPPCPLLLFLIELLYARVLLSWLESSIIFCTTLDAIASSTSVHLECFIGALKCLASKCVMPYEL